MAKPEALTKVSSPEGPGAALRALRIQKGWTLAEVAKRSGLPVSTLSKLENDKMSLTYDKLTRISGALEVEIAQLLSGDAAVPPAGRSSGRRSVTRAGEGKVIDTGKYYYRYLATDLLNKHFVPIVGEMRARSIEVFGELIRHSGEEFIYVLEGVIEVHTSLYAPLRLEKDDSVYLDSEMPHAFIAAASGPCRILSICSASESQFLHDVSEPKRRTQGNQVKPAASGSKSRRVRTLKKR